MVKENKQARRPANPFSHNEQIFKCLLCENHKYLPELSDTKNICKACYEQKNRKANRSPQIEPLEGVQRSSGNASSSNEESRKDHSDATTTDTDDASSNSGEGSGGN